MNPYQLAEELDVVVWKSEEVPGLNRQTLRQLVQEDPASWSAATVCTDSRQAIILNSSHSSGRRASSLTHELSHLLLGHEAGRVDVSESGLLLHTYQRQQEDEAGWLAGCLLLPREALVAIRRERLAVAAATKKYGVTPDMLRFRMNVTGVDRQLQRYQGTKGPR